PAIASSVFLGVVPPVGVAALKKRARQSSLATVKDAVISEPRVSKLAIVVVMELLSGSSSTLPHPPVERSTRSGTFPAAIFSPSGFPEIPVLLMKRAFVNTDATVVSSLIVTLAGGLLPTTAKSAMAGLSPPALLALATPPVATRYRMPSLLAPLARTSKRPSSLVLVWASCLGAPELASHNVTVDFAMGAPP